MTERPMWDGGPGEHLDEGTIHAWLDGALDAASAERVAEHVRNCEACSALAAEARGLIAGASRVISALDDVPTGARPGWAQAAAGEAAEPDASPMASAAEDRSLWRRLRVTPARAAIAATILVALGVTLTHDRVAIESVRREATLPVSPREPAANAPGAAMATVTPPAPPKDALLDSAVARNLSIAQGTPHVEAARTPAIPAAPPPSSARADAPVAMAEQQVAEGRAALQAQRDTAWVVADRLRVRGDVGSTNAARAADEASAYASARREMSKAAPSVAGAVAGAARPNADAGARSCFRLESAQAGATWGDQPLPLVVIVDSGPPVGTRSASVRSGASGASLQAAWRRSANDSVTLTLQRGGMGGTIALGPDAGGRAGMATVASMEESVASKRTEAEADVRARAARRPSPVTPGAPTASAQSRPAPLNVTLRPAACPSR